jgi:hypothetical protein
MRPFPAEFLLMLGYAIALAGIAVVLEWVARHAHRRSLSIATAGFTYHRDRDIWRCPQDQHLFPIFAGSAREDIVYRAPATACNSCKSKAACTDSNHGRELQLAPVHGTDFGMRKFHNAISLTLLVLASVILSVELIRAGTLMERAALGSVLAIFCVIIRWLFMGLQ